MLEKYGFTNSRRFGVRVNSILGREAWHFSRGRSRRHCHQALPVLLERDLRFARKTSGIRMDRLQEDPDLDLGLSIDRGA
jgi:hypothetical protein